MNANNKLDLCNCFNKTTRDGVNFSMLTSEAPNAVLDMTWVKCPIFITKEQRKNLYVATEANMKLIKGYRK